MDTMSADDRSRVMSKNRARDTRLEMTLRRALHGLGFRYRVNQRGLPGCPDMVFAKYGAVIQVHGCYWHAHGCQRFSVPKSNTEKWKSKFNKNKERDSKARVALNNLGYRQLTVWECALRNGSKYCASEVLEHVAEWLTHGSGNEEIPARNLAVGKSVKLRKKLRN